MENISETNLDLKNIELNNNGIDQLNRLRKWTLFISIVGFVFIGLVTLTPILALFFIDPESPSALSALAFLPLILINIIYFFPVYYLFRFSSFSKQAIINSDSIILTQALKYLRKHYQFMGILLIIMLSMYTILGVIMFSSDKISNVF